MEGFALDRNRCSRRRCCPPLTVRSSGWISKLAVRYNHDAAAGVADKPPDSPRAVVPSLTAELSLELDAALHQSAPNGGLWTANKVAAWIEAKTKRRVHETTAWRAMRALGFTLQRPRPQHKKAAMPDEQEGWKKN